MCVLIKTFIKAEQRYSQLPVVMSVFKLLFLSCALLSVVEGLQTVAYAPRIIGGRGVKPGELPYQVGIQRKYYFGNGSFHWCGGSIVTIHHVITAAHCLSGLPVAELQVFGGVVNNTWQSQEPTKVLRDVSAVYLHEDFVYDTYYNDIAILTVTEDFPMGNFAIATIPLAIYDPPEGTQCIASGWGVLADGSLPTILQEVQVPFIPRKSCSRMYNGTHEGSILPGMACAGYAEGGKDACEGDSGGPLMCTGFLVGIVSTGEGCAQANFPGVYASIPYYKEWIVQTLYKSEIELLWQRCNNLETNVKSTILNKILSSSKTISSSS